MGIEPISSDPQSEVLPLYESHSDPSGTRTQHFRIESPVNEPFIRWYHSATDYRVIGSSNEVRMHSVKQNQDLHSRACKHTKYAWHKIDGCEIRTQHF